MHSLRSSLYRGVCYIGRNKCTRSILYTRRLPYTFRIRFIRTVGFVISVGFIISIEFFIPEGFVLSDGLAISVRFVLTLGLAIYRLDSLFSEIHYNARFTSIITAKTPEKYQKMIQIVFIRLLFRLIWTSSKNQGFHRNVICTIWRHRQ